MKSAWVLAAGALALSACAAGDYGPREEPVGGDGGLPSIDPGAPPRKPGAGADDEPLPGEKPPGGEQCGAIGPEGLCQGAVLVECRDGQLTRTVCPAEAPVCAFVELERVHQCISDGGAPPPPVDDDPLPGQDPPPEQPGQPGAPCGDVDYLGHCAGDVAEWCQDGALAQANCAANGLTCGWIDGVTGYYCTDAPGDPGAGGEDPPPPAGGDCGDVDYLGYCEGNVAIWCENGALRQHDCAAEGQPCGWVDDVAGFYCGGSGDGPPEADPGGGREDEPPSPPSEDPPVEEEPPTVPEPPAGGDDCYSEPWADGASLAGPRQMMGGDWRQAAREVMRIRWPAGSALLQDGAEVDLESFGDGSGWSPLLESMMTVIHEGTHGWDYAHASWGRTFAYFIAPGRHVEITHVEGFPRAEIAADLPDDSTSLYAGTYLVGEQGSRGFPELMDEGNCYINGMAALAVAGDEYQGGGISGRDGAVAFLLYTQLYLRRARDVHRDTWDALRAEPEIRELVALQWQRSHFWLEVADRYPEIGISDGQIRRHLYTAENLGVLREFTGYELGRSACRSSP